MSDPFVQRAEPEAVFATLADETRLSILRALWDADADRLPFSGLREAVGADDSGRFNYHLDELVGTFVARTDEGYALTQAGRQVNGAISSGVYTTAATIDPIDLDAPCRACGGARTLRYADEVARIECASCPAGWEAPVPPAVLAGHDRDEVPAAVSRYLRTTFRQVVDGVCQYCHGRMEPTVGPQGAMDVGPDAAEGDDDDDDEDVLAPDFPVIQLDCRRCGARAGVSLDHGLLFARTAVECFYHEHGIDLRARPVWDVPGLDPGRATVERRDPVRASVTFRVDGAALTVTVDGQFRTVGVEAAD
jgi:hypothetical protein